MSVLKGLLKSYKTTPSGWNGTSNPRFRRDCFLRCGCFFLSAENDDIFSEKIWWNKNLKAFVAPKQKDHSEGALLLSQEGL